MIYYLIYGLIFIFLLFIIFIYLLNIKIKKLEIKILKQFKEKNNQIPSIYEATKKYLNKHDEIFKESIRLKKKDFSENNFYDKLIKKLDTNKLIHNELNFIFRVCNKHPKLNKDGKFLYIKDIIIDKSSELGDNLMTYKQITKKFNRIIFLKNITIIGLLFPIETKDIII
ncbi:MAG: LemA family protein [Candidatus Gracilibacteria bacterium]